MHLLRRLARPEPAATCLHGIVDECTALEEAAAPGTHVPAAPSQALRLIATTAGSATLEADGTALELPARSIAVLAPGWAYRRRVNRERWHIHALLLRGPWAGRIAAACAATGGARLVLRPPGPWRTWLVEAVALAIDRPPHWDLRFAARLAGLAAALCSQDGAGLGERVLALTSAEPARRWDVADLADALGLGRSAFAHRFTREVGEPPRRWLTRRRLDAAAGLLASRTPGEVADLLGFADQFHFSRAFRRRFGIPPSRWRQRDAGEDARI